MGENDLYIIHQALRELSRFSDEHEDAHDATDPVPLDIFVRQTVSELKLRVFRSESLSNSPVNESTAATLKEVTDESLGICSAEAYYYRGLLSLRRASDSGEISNLWKGHAVLPENESCSEADAHECASSCSALEKARRLFKLALTNAPPASSTLTKNIMRCLALATGPEDSLVVASLIQISVGGTARNIVRDLCTEGEALDSFRVFDDELMDHNARIEAVGQLIMDSATLIPRHFHISTMTCCPTGELLICSLRNFTNSQHMKVSTVCILPASTDIEKSSIYADVLHPLDRIIERSQRQLRGIDEEAQSEHYTEQSSRRRWWDERHAIDEDLQHVLKKAERTYFNKDLARQGILPDDLFAAEGESCSLSDDEVSECSDIGPGNLESRFEAAEQEPISQSTSSLQDFDRNSELSKLTKMTVAVIKSKLEAFGVSGKETKKMRKAELIDVLLSEMENSINTGCMEVDENPTVEEESGDTTQSTVEASHGSEEPCVILCLDEHLLRFPFESMDMFSGITVTRVPSLPFVLATLRESETLHSDVTPKVDARKVKYVVDPESNLTESASTLSPALNSIASQNGWEWEGVEGRMPATGFMKQALREEDGMYLYCGHGGGQKAFSRSEIEGLISGREDGIRGCRATVVLMGCSSGKLQSVNAPKENPDGCAYPIHYEPEGIALTYLLCGAPCVVGNLWDVTDRDIDR